MESNLFERPEFNAIRCVKSAAAKGDDRVVIREFGGGVILGVFDGAGGIAGGAQAAEHLARAVAGIQESQNVSDPEAWAEWLSKQDGDLLDSPVAGEAAGVVAFVHRGVIVGASVGDCVAMLVSEDASIELTKLQQRKPLLGSGASAPFEFGPEPFHGRLLMATDGLHKYANRQRLLETLRTSELPALPEDLLALVRLRSGGMQDDCGFLVIQMMQES